MPLAELLQRLVNVTPGQKLFLSVYLDLRPDQTGKKNHTTFLKTRLAELSNLIPARSPEQSLLAKDVKRLQKYLAEDLDASWKGLAIFSCPEEDLFIPISMPIPPANDLNLSPYPCLFSLLRHAALYQTHAVVVANSRQARLFIVRLGSLAKQISLTWDEKHTTRFGRLGLSTQRFQRHLQEHVKQQGKEIVESLEKLLVLEKPEYLFFVAEEGKEAELKKQLPAALKKKVTPLSSFATHDPDHKILSGATEALGIASRAKTEIVAQHILQEAEPLGQAMAGPEPALSALQNHQVERLIIDSRFDAGGWKCTRCLRLGMGGSPNVCPYCGGGICSANLREEIVIKALSQGVDLLFTENYSPLLKVGGIAALLKYKSPKKTMG